MIYKTFLTKINIWTKIGFCTKHNNYSNSLLFSSISPNFKHKSRLNFLFNSLFTSRNKSLSFDGKTSGPIKMVRRGFAEERPSQRGDDNDDNDDGRDQSDPSNRKHLMIFKPILFPNLWFNWKNFLSINTIIRPFFDNEFTINGFMSGAKQALVRISNCLADEDLNSLKGLVTEEALNEIKSNYVLMNSSERNSLRVDFEDIMLSFPYRIGIIMNDDDRRWVEITVVYYCLYKYKGLIETKQMSFEEFRKKFSKSMTICNYRFIREYTKGVDSQWTVNLLGHFNDIDSL